MVSSPYFHSHRSHRLAATPAPPLPWPSFRQEGFTLTLPLSGKGSWDPWRCSRRPSPWSGRCLGRRFCRHATLSRTIAYIYRIGL